MVFQSYALFPHLSVAENIVFGLQGAARAGGRPRAPARARRRRCSASSTLLDRKPSQLSGGQQQRVALGRAIIAETPVCLMDEPLSNLDAQLRQEMRREIRALQQQLGITMVYVTHDQTEAMSMADQVVLLRDGRIEQDAPPAELYARPGDRVRRALHRHAADEPPRRARPAPTCKLGVRPEHVAAGRPTAALEAVVQGAEYLGADTVVTCTSSAGGRRLRRAPAGPLDARRRRAAVRLGWAPEHSHCFDAATAAAATTWPPSRPTARFRSQHRIASRRHA